MLSPHCTEGIPHCTDVIPHCTECPSQYWCYPPLYWCYTPACTDVIPPMYWIPSTLLKLSPNLLMLSPTVLNNLHNTEASPHMYCCYPPQYWRYPSTVLVLSPTVLMLSPLYWTTSTVLTDVIWGGHRTNFRNRLENLWYMKNIPVLERWRNGKKLGVNALLPMLCRLHFRKSFQSDSHVYVIYETRVPVFQQRGKTSDWSIFAGKPPLIDQWQGYRTWENDVSLFFFALFRKIWTKSCPILNRIRVQTWNWKVQAVHGTKDLKFWTMVVHNISKHCHFLWLLVTEVTPHFASFLTELGHKL